MLEIFKNMHLVITAKRPNILRYSLPIGAEMTSIGGAFRAYPMFQLFNHLSRQLLRYAAAESIPGCRRSTLSADIASFARLVAWHVPAACQNERRKCVTCTPWLLPAWQLHYSHYHRCCWHRRAGATTCTTRTAVWS